MEEENQEETEQNEVDGINVKFKYIFQFLTPNFAYSLCHFHWALMKNKGCSLSEHWTLNTEFIETHWQQNAE